MTTLELIQYFNELRQGLQDQIEAVANLPNFENIDLLNEISENVWEFTVYTHDLPPNDSVIIVNNGTITVEEIIRNLELLQTYCEDYFNKVKKYLDDSENYSKILTRLRTTLEELQKYYTKLVAFKETVWTLN